MKANLHKKQLFFLLLSSLFNIIFSRNAEIIIKKNNQEEFDPFKRFLNMDKIAKNMMGN